VRAPGAAHGELSVLVVDDEPLARERLVRLLKGLAGVTIAGEAGDGQSALQLLAKASPDVLLLDVEMPGMDGLELARVPGLPPVVFTTAHVRFATDAFDLDAVDFLPKPVRAERLAEALERVRRRLAEGAPRTRAPVKTLAVHEPGGIRFVDPSGVAVFRARDKYTEFTHEGAEQLVRESLDALEARLGAEFVRVHRGTLVRVAAIRELAQVGDALVARLASGGEVEVSRRAAPVVRRALGLRK
jgi:DNA-binding LytR/AlgR family response regulator